MLSERVLMISKLLQEVLPEPLQAYHVYLIIVTNCGLAWLVWRLWIFTVVPRLYPHDPKVLPYWLPIIGHSVSFFSNSNGLLDRARLQLGNKREPFALTVAGTTLYVLTESKDVAEAYRNTRTLSFNKFVQSMMRATGNTEPCVQTMYKPLPQDKKGFPNPHMKPLAALAREMHIHQLYPGENLGHLCDQFREFFEANLNLQTLDKRCPYAVQSAELHIVLPLMQWCSDYFTRAGQNAYFGDQLSQVDPGMTDTFIVFDELSWQVLYLYPDILAGEMKSAKHKLKEDLKEYMQIPQSQRSGDAWFTKSMENEMRDLGISEDDIATMFVTIYWGINTNTRKACFWMLAYILREPGLIDVVREETKPAFQHLQVDFQYLNDDCPKLAALWNETIRMTSYSASVRYVTEDTFIGGKLLRKGNRLMIPYRQLHFDERIFGDTANTFEADRFIKKKNLTRSDSWRPFGGGLTMCPGRYIAKQAVIMFVAMVLHRFDIELADEQQSFPEPELGKPVLGIMSNKSRQDLKVRLSPTKSRS